MTADFERFEETIDVPREAGVEGFLRALREVLTKPRVQEVKIDARGKMHVVRFVRPNEPRDPLNVDFSSVTPAAAVRSGFVIEVPVAAGEEPLRAVCSLFHACELESMYPICFITGADSRLPTWLGIDMFDFLNAPIGSDLKMCGLRLLKDRNIPDDALILATAYGPNADLIDVRNCYKLTIPLSAPVQEPVVLAPAVRMEEEGTPT